MEDVQCERVDAQSISGIVTFSGPLARNGRYALKSHSGEVTVAITGGTGFELEASSFSGQVRSDVPITTRGGVDTGRPATDAVWNLRRRQRHPRIDDLQRKRGHYQTVASSPSAGTSFANL